MLFDRIVFGVLVVLAFLLGAATLVVAVTGPASADPVSIEWTNTAGPEYPHATIALACAGTACSSATTDCAPGATCTTVHDLPPGEYPQALLMVAAPGAGWLWSGPVPGTLTVEPTAPSGGVCRHDVTGDGQVTTADFSSFMGEFWGGCDGG